MATQGRVTDSDIEQVFQALKACPNYIIKPMYWIVCLIPLLMLGGMGAMFAILFTSTRSGGPNYLAFLIMPAIFIILIVILCFAQKANLEKLASRLTEFNLVLAQQN